MTAHELKRPTQRWLTLGYAVAIAALIINAVFTVWSLNTVRTTWDTLVADREYLRGIDKVLSDLKDAETGQRGYLLTGDDRYLEPYTNSHTLVPAAIDRLRALAGDDANRQQHLKAVEDASAAKLAELEQTISVRRQDGVEAALAIVKSDRGKEAMDRIVAELTALRAEEDAKRAPLRSRLQAAINRTVVAFAFASTVALGLLVVHLLSERHRRQLRRDAAWLSTTLRSIGDAVNGGSLQTSTSPFTLPTHCHNPFGRHGSKSPFRSIACCEVVTPPASAHSLIGGLLSPRRNSRARRSSDSPAFNNPSGFFSSSALRRARDRPSAILAFTSVAFGS
jgi:CHASE3 domain sensor protein